MKLLRNSPLVCAVSIFAVQRLTILDSNLCDDMGHGNVAMYLLLAESKPEDIMSLVYWD
jgi:hypothetical protein